MPDPAEDNRRVVNDPFEESFPSPDSEEADAEQLVDVPPDALSPQALMALIEEFVTRSGTELGNATDKVAQVRALLQAGKVRIVFDPNVESCNIVEV